MDAILIYMTCRDESEAETIVRRLLEDRLIACANISGAQRSFYHWQGAIESNAETIVIMKSRAELLEQIRAKVVALHSYDCPCLLAIPIVAGHEPFLRWLEEETSAMQRQRI